MFKTQDFEKLWFGYKTEGEPNSMSIERYCMMKGVPYSLEKILIIWDRKINDS